MKIRILKTAPLLSAVFAGLAILAGLFVLGEIAASAQQSSSNGAGSAEIGVLPLRGNVYMLVGAGGNITASVGSEGVMLVDTGLENMAAKVLAAVNKLSVEVETKG